MAAKNAARRDAAAAAKPEELRPRQRPRPAAEGNSIRCGCKAHFTVRHRADQPDEMEITYHKMEHNHDLSRRARFMSEDAKLFVKMQLLLNPDIKNPVLQQSYLEHHYLHPLRVEHPDWTDDQLREEVTRLAQTDRDVLLDADSIDNIRKARQRAHRLRRMRATRHARRRARAALRACGAAPSASTARLDLTSVSSRRSRPGRTCAGVAGEEVQPGRQRRPGGVDQGAERAVRGGGGRVPGAAVTGCGAAPQARGGSLVVR